jgi:hypothetical protein
MLNIYPGALKPYIGIEVDCTLSQAQQHSRRRRVELV